MAARSKARVAQLAINARTFRTDDSFRDDSIRGHILEAETYEFITFTPTELRGLPETSPAVGETIQFEIVGDLSVHGMTQTKVFEAEVTLVDENTLAGTATTEATYTEFNITIRTPPLVSEVKDALTLSIEFVATRAEE
ncbi:MAG: YceI family protein [Chloroflexi bacterium]|nr:YceI family protein [Chloroflexota bacterium]